MRSCTNGNSHPESNYLSFPSYNQTTMHRTSLYDCCLQRVTRRLWATRRVCREGAILGSNASNEYPSVKMLIIRACINFWLIALGSQTEIHARYGVFKAALRLLAWEILGFSWNEMKFSSCWCYYLKTFFFYVFTFFFSLRQWNWKFKFLLG